LLLRQRPVLGRANDRDGRQWRRSWRVGVAAGSAVGAADLRPAAVRCALRNAANTPRCDRVKSGAAGRPAGSAAAPMRAWLRACVRCDGGHGSSILRSSDIGREPRAAGSAAAADSALPVAAGPRGQRGGLRGVRRRGCAAVGSGAPTPASRAGSTSSSTSSSSRGRRREWARRRRQRGEAAPLA